MLDTILVSLGAVLGVNIRFIMYRKFEKRNISKYSCILLINTFASFLLGLVLSFLPRISFYDLSYRLGLFLIIGFLGSLSTFSTFFYDLFSLLLKLKFCGAIKLFFISSTLGIIAVAFGFFLGNL